jgi:hypothetical protein
MTTSTVIWIVVAVVAAIVLIALIGFVATRTRTRHRRVEADRIREDANERMGGVQKREALAQETEARARAAKAEADAKAAEAARLQERAQTHRGEAATAREELEDRLGHADRIDPRSTDRGREGREQHAASPATEER